MRPLPKAHTSWTLDLIQCKSYATKSYFGYIFINLWLNIRCAKKKNVPLSHKMFHLPKKCLIFGYSTTQNLTFGLLFYGTLERFLGHPIKPLSSKLEVIFTSLIYDPMQDAAWRLKRFFGKWKIIRKKKKMKNALSICWKKSTNSSSCHTACWATSTSCFRHKRQQAHRVADMIFQAHHAFDIIDNKS